ncbi:MAG: hypothetical protein PSX36_09465 [bacterium]|nr:hypothetical protein [bacterium]
MKPFLKKARFIFSLFFLLGMLFTVFQYFPAQKQEILVQKTELVKKMKSCDASEDETDTEDDNSPTESDFDLFSYDWLTTHNQEHKFYTQNIEYRFQRKPVHTPPPKF